VATPAPPEEEKREVGRSLRSGDLAATEELQASITWRQV